MGYNIKNIRMILMILRDFRRMLYLQKHFQLLLQLIHNLLYQQVSEWCEDRKRSWITQDNTCDWKMQLQQWFTTYSWMIIILTKVDAKCFEDCCPFKVNVTSSLCKRITTIKIFPSTLKNVWELEYLQPVVTSKIYTFTLLSILHNWLSCLTKEC